MFDLDKVVSNISRFQKIEMKKKERNKMKDKKQMLIWKLIDLYKGMWDDEMLWDFVETQLYLNNQTQDIEEKIKEVKELYMEEE